LSSKFSFKSRRFAQQIEDDPCEFGGAVRVGEELVFLVLMDVAAVDNGVVQGFIEVAQHGLLGAVVGDLIHDALVLAELVADRVSIVDEILFGELIGDEKLVETVDD
jgi:hypothetical protein